MPPAAAAFRSQVDDPIGCLDQFQVVFHDDHGVACIHEALEHPQQTGGIGQVQAGGRFVEQIQRATGDAAAQFLCQLHALGFAA